MAQKLINTRIGLKYDLATNWEPGQKSYVPLKGEVIFYEFPSEIQGENPAILFKVGDGVKDLEHLPFGSAIAADVYAWAKQRSLLGGTESSGTWTWSQDSAYAQEQAEVSAFVKKETANIKIRIVPTTPPAEHAGEDSWYDTEVSTDNGTTWIPSNTPFKITIEAYTAGAGLQLNNNEFSLDIESEYLTAGSGAGLDIVESTVTYTPSSQGTDPDLTATDGIVTGDAISAIKQYVDNSTGATVVNVEKQPNAESGYAATYVVTQNGVQVGEKINIPKDFLVKSGTVEVCETADTPVAGLEVGDKYLDFVVNSVDGGETDQHIYIPVKDLTDIYIGGTTNTASVTVSNSNEITVDVNKFTGNLANLTSGDGTDEFVDARQVKDYVDGEITDARTEWQQDIADAVQETVENMHTHSAGNGIELTDTNNDINIAVKLGGSSNNPSGLAFEGSGNGLVVDDSLIWQLNCGDASHLNNQ